MSYMCVRVCLVAQSCPTLCEPMDYSLPGSSVHGIFQVRSGFSFPLPGNLPDPGMESLKRILEWMAIAFSRESLQPRDWTHVSNIFCIAGRFFFYHWNHQRRQNMTCATRELNLGCKNGNLAWYHYTSSAAGYMYMCNWITLLCIWN